MKRLVMSTLALGMFVALTAGIAGGALKTRTASTTLEVEPGSATAQCKAGTKAVSGGFDSTDPDPLGETGSFVPALVSERLSKRQWTTASYNYGDPGDLITHAYCSDALPRLKAKAVTETVGPNSAGTATVRCKKGGEAVSGGFVSPADDPSDITTYQFESRRIGKRSWHVSAFNDDGTESRQLTAIAYCAKHKLGLKQKSATTTFDEDGEIASAKARCKKGTKAVSGGYAGLTTESESVESFPFQSRREGGRGWLAAAFGYSSEGDTIDFETFVYCLDKEEL